MIVMEWLVVVLEGLGLALFVVLVAPVVWLVAGLVMACVVPPFLRASPTIARTSFECPFSRQRVRAEFLVSDAADRPTDVTSCSAFGDPRCIRCKKQCLELATRAYALAPMLPRYSLIAGGTAYRIAA